MNSIEIIHKNTKVDVNFTKCGTIITAKEIDQIDNKFNIIYWPIGDKVWLEELSELTGIYSLEKHLTPSELTQVLKKLNLK